MIVFVCLFFFLLFFLSFLFAFSDYFEVVTNGGSVYLVKLTPFVDVVLIYFRII